MTIDFQFLFVDRDNLKILLEDINHQKKILKEQGITIDGIDITLLNFLVRISLGLGICFKSKLQVFI